MAADASGFAAGNPVDLIRRCGFLAGAVPLAALGLFAAVRLVGNRETEPVARPGAT